MLLNVLDACIGRILVGAEDKRGQTLGTALIGAATRWVLRDVNGA